MAIDCPALSSKAQEIFAKLEPFFPPNPWGKPQWFAEGKISDDGWYDLRLATDRRRLEEKLKGLIGHFVELKAESYRKKHACLTGFTNEHFDPGMQKQAEVLLLLKDLDFQIETLDLCGD